MIQLNKRQACVVFELSGNTLVTASPGSGKTRTLVFRAQHKIESLSKYKSIALIAYTNAAADEIAARIISQDNLFIGTIHSFCLEFILRPFGWLYGWKRPRVISYDELVAFFEENEDIDLGHSKWQSKFDELLKIKKRLDGKLDETIEWEHDISLESVANRFFEYQKMLGVIDFNEILFRSFKIIDENKFVATSVANKFHEILVDEFQDTNIYQYEILKKINEIGSCTFFMVGDDRQKIFSFAGAIEDAFESALHDFNSAKEVLTEVYRSTSNVVEAYSGLFENHPSLKNESVLKNIDIPILIRQTDKQNHDRYLKSCIKHLTEKCNVPLSEIAILSTSWFSSFNASKALRQHYNIVGPGALPHKSIYNSTFSLLKALSFYFYDPNPRSLKGVKRNIDRHILENNLTIQHDDITIKTNKLITGFQEFDTENTLIEGVPILKALFNHIFEIPHSTFDEIIDSIEDKELPTWSTQQYIEVLSGTSGIVNNTIHKAKGLEFDAVILNEMNENKIPYQKVLDTQNWIYEELTEKQIEEGRKLFYVALSRAKKYLIILHNWKPSMFIPVLNV